MKTPQTIRDYIKTESPVAQKALKKMHAILRKAAPKASEKLAWGMPTLHLEGNLVHFAAFKNHLSLFPGSDAMRFFEDQLTKYKTSKGTVQFPYDEALPVALITRIVKFCVKENLASAKAKALAKGSKAKSKAKATRKKAVSKRK